MIRFFNQAVGATSPNAKPSNKVIGMAMMKFFEISDSSFNIVFSRALASGWPTRSGLPALRACPHGLSQAFFKSTDLILAFNYTWPLAALRGSIGACLIRAIPRPKFA